VVRANCRQLNCKTYSLFSYMKILETLMDEHKMDGRLYAIIDAIVDDTPMAEQDAKMEGLDRQMVELQKCAERRCRKVIKPNMEFSGLVKLWHERVQAYKALIKWKTGNSCNSSNIIRTALRRGISNPRQLSLEQMQLNERYSKARRRLLKDTAPQLRKEHLRSQLLSAERKQDEEQRKRIQAKIHRETSKKMWYFINRSQKDPRCGAFHFVQRVVDNVVQELTTQTSTEDYIFEETEMRFKLAAQALISSTKLIEQLGYLGDSEIARQIVEGTYNFQTR